MTKPPYEPLDPKKLPKHVGVIMDGNGRWAKARGLPRTAGHEAGEDALVDAVDGALEIGLKYLTVYAFSTENWRRPADEVRFLMNYNRELLTRRRDEFNEKGVRIRFIGRRNDRKLPRSVVRMAEEAEDLTVKNKKLNLTIALNYGGWAEVVDAVQHLLSNGTKRVTEKSIRAELYAPELPDPDLIIRTSGEKRISNFLLWQGAYAELLFTDVLWPDFRRTDLFAAIAEYQRRSRRFGAVD
jgi:undecaprenyl diphosphate synthase